MLDFLAKLGQFSLLSPFLRLLTLSKNPLACLALLLC